MGLQFTILSGHTDYILDFASYFVPPQRYDLWMFLGILWFLLPVALDVRYRSAFENMDLSSRKKLKTEEDYGVELGKGSLRNAVLAAPLSAENATLSFALHVY